ncbi:PaaI family thioesterase [Skermania sp. ID1734]|uniref:PaaI family thioesterase n=1 Tax=Skermania sp. ID1734 TaxID=2597516 RepID=UPI00117D96D5|nr:PaaI family thioesterase [Skermania sp. ID1734]TSE01064.1 PaaI family thioesterase [Skermania sp. ID1734]
MTDTAELSVPTTGSEAIQAFLPLSPFVGILGIELVDMSDGRARLRLPYRDELTTVGQMVHGGVLSACIDIGIMAAAWAGPRLPEKLRGVTVSMSIDYVAPAQAEDVEIIATRLRQGRRLIHCSVELRGARTGELIAQGLGAYQIG